MWTTSSPASTAAAGPTSCRPNPRSAAGNPATCWSTAARTASTAGTSSPPARTTTCPTVAASALEQELLVVLVEEQGDLVEQVGVGLEAALAVHDGERHLTGLLHPFAIAAQRRQLQVAAALLPLPHDRALAPQVEVDLGQGEPVGAADQRTQPCLGLRRLGLADQVAPRPLAPPAHAAPELVELGDAEAVGIEDHHDGGVGDVDAHLDHRRGHQHVEPALAELVHRGVLVGRAQATVQQPEAKPGQLAGLEPGEGVLGRTG